jgi:hypothetical protein
MRLALLQEFVTAVEAAVRAGKEVPQGKYPPDYHIYEVADRRAGPEGISVVVRYVGDELAAQGSEPPVKRRFVSSVQTLDDFRRMLVKAGTDVHRRPRGASAGGAPREKSSFSRRTKRFLKIIISTIGATSTRKR